MSTRANPAASAALGIINSSMLQPKACKRIRFASSEGITYVDVEFSEEISPQDICKLAASAHPIQLVSIRISGEFIPALEASVQLEQSNIVNLRFLGGPIDRTELLSVIKEECAICAPEPIRKTFAITVPDIFYGADSRALPLAHMQQQAEQILIFGSTCIALSEAADRGHLKVRRFDPELRRIDERHLLSDIVSPDVNALLRRYRHNPKFGLDLVAGKSEVGAWTIDALRQFKSLRSYVELKVKAGINFELERAGEALSKRLADIRFRKRVYTKSAAGKRLDIGVCPENETETIILFAKLLAHWGGTIINGPRIEILDYSPRGIDCIGSWQRSAQEPKILKPIEIEYHLASFFAHGHPWEHAMAIVCFTRVGWDIVQSGGNHKVIGEDGIFELHDQDTGQKIDLIVISELKNVDVEPASH